MIFENTFIEKVQRSSDIIDIISQYTHLKGKGGHFMGLCPFPGHDEKTPSFSISQDKQVYHCFGCGQSGNIFSFLKNYQGLTFPDAVEYLARRAHIDLPVSQKKKFQKSEKEIDLKRFNAFCKDKYVKCLKSLPKDHPANIYLESRQFEKNILNTFCVGYAPDQWNFISQSMKDKGYSFNKVSELGLFKSKDTKSYYDIFRNRIIFPILSPSGDILGFGGRVLDDSKPKYLNSPATSIFNKSQIFYGLHETAREIRHHSYAIVVEGYTDLISLYQQGFKNVVATLGTALTPDHAKLLKRYTKNVITIFDGDDAGIQASEKAMQHLMSEGLTVKGLYLPEGEDPDSFLKKFGPQRLSTDLETAQDLYTLYLDKMLKTQSISQVSDKMKVVEAATQVLALVKNKFLRDLYIEETALRLSVDKQWLFNILRNTKTNAQRFLIQKV